VRLHDHLEEFLERVGLELERDLLEGLARGGLGRGLTGIDLPAGHVVHLAIARGHHEHAAIAHEGDRRDEQIGQVGRLGHPFHPIRGTDTRNPQC
jgi:hypothetical protein